MIGVVRLDDDGRLVDARCQAGRVDGDVDRLDPSGAIVPSVGASDSQGTSENGSKDSAYGTPFCRIRPVSWPLSTPNSTGWPTATIPTGPEPVLDQRRLTVRRRGGDHRRPVGQVREGHVARRAAGQRIRHAGDQRMARRFDRVLILELRAVDGHPPGSVTPSRFPSWNPNAADPNQRKPPPATKAENLSMFAW